jgi:hypothetical protein
MVDIACLREYQYCLLEDGTLRQALRTSLDRLPYLKKDDAVLKWLCPPAIKNFMLEPKGGAVFVRPTGGKVVSVSNAKFVDIIEACKYKGRYALLADGSLRQAHDDNIISWCPFDLQRETKLWESVAAGREVSK